MPPKWKWVVAISAAVLGVSLAAWGGWPRALRPADRSGIANVARNSWIAALVASAAASEQRPIDGRLSGGFLYAPPGAATRSVAATRRTRVLAVMVAIRKRADSATDADALHALGVAHVLLREWDDAVDTLERAVARQPRGRRFRTTSRQRI